MVEYRLHRNLDDIGTRLYLRRQRLRVAAQAPPDRLAGILPPVAGATIQATVTLAAPSAAPVRILANIIRRSDQSAVDVLRMSVAEGQIAAGASTGVLTVQRGPNVIVATREYILHIQLEGGPAIDVIFTG